MNQEAPVTHERYLHQAQFALFGCQMVEEVLKSLVMHARDVNRIAPAEYAPISESNDELDELPLGRLIPLFRKVLPGSNILPDLERLRPERNHCAHRALVLCFISDVSDDISLDKEFARISIARQLAWSCFEVLKPLLAAAEKRLAALSRSPLSP
jgi:hypothetical protein